MRSFIIITSCIAAFALLLFTYYGFAVLAAIVAIIATATDPQDERNKYNGGEE